MFIGEDPCGLCGYGKKENVRAYSTIEADPLYAYMLYDESLSYGMKVADMHDACKAGIYWHENVCPYALDKCQCRFLVQLHEVK